MDYALRQRQLESAASSEPAELLQNWRDGRIKMFIIHRLLTLRREHPDHFATGTYTQVNLSGSFAEKIIAFERRSGNETILIVVPRHTAPLGYPPIGEVWADTQIASPTLMHHWRNIFTAREHAGEYLRLSDVLAELPVAVLAGS